MNLAVLVLTATFAGLLLLILVVVGISRHKKSSSRAPNLIGATGFIERKLDPEGAVIIDGELWRARADNGAALKARSRVRVVGAQAHLLLVESQVRQT